MIVIGFPGVGKTVASAHYNIRDLESSEYPSLENYAQALAEYAGPDVHAFGSSHKEVRDWLRANTIPFVTVGPQLVQRACWLARLANRDTGLNDPEFVDLIDRNWRTWVRDLYRERRFYPINCEVPNHLDEVLDRLGIDLR